MRKKIKNLFSFLIVVIAIIALIYVYDKYNFNDFEKNISEKNVTVFERDSSVKYSKANSYKIENQDYTDSMISQKIKVTPNTSYRVTCMVKVKDVENKDSLQKGGAHISLIGEAFRSIPIYGTSDWRQITLMFNSKNHTEVEIGFRLGGYAEQCKGTAWFSDFKLEAGSINNSGKWKMACFIFPTIDVNVNNNGKTERILLHMTDDDVRNVQSNLQRFQNSIPELTHNKMQIEYDTFIINNPIDSISYDEENDYYVSSEDVKKYLEPYLKQTEYDHIYVAFRMADKQQNSNTLISDWIGLGGMDYEGIGFSNIRMPDDENNLIYQYNYKYNTFPEEVFIHEFLHTIERNSKDYGYEIPKLHDYEKYGYIEDSVDGQRKWYEDYMNQNVSYQGQKIGVKEEMYNHKPVHPSDFKYARKLDEFQEPSNIIEIIRSLFSRVAKLFSSAEEIAN